MATSRIATFVSCGRTNLFHPHDAPSRKGHLFFIADHQNPISQSTERQSDSNSIDTEAVVNQWMCNQQQWLIHATT
jgi:hypothetical protein